MCGSLTWVGVCRVASRSMPPSTPAPSGRRTGVSSSSGLVARAATTCSRSPRVAPLRSNRCSSRRNESPLDWSQDGRFLLYSTQNPKTASDIWALPLMGERKPFAVLQSSFDEIQGQFSPDGRWLAYASNESGRYEIYVRTFPEAGGKWQVSAAGGMQPRWRRDGQESVLRCAGYATDGGAASPGAGCTRA